MSSSSGCMQLYAIGPELIMAGMGLALVPVAGWARGKWRMIPLIVAGIGILSALGLTGYMLTWPPETVFCETYAVDGFASTFKILMLLGAFITLLMLWAYFRDHEQIAHAPIALIFSTLGCMGLSSALDMVMVVLFLQMLSLASYLLVSLVRTDSGGNEATIKYFIYAAVALAIMAYGLTFFYGLTGSLEFRHIGQYLLTGGDPVWIAVGAGLVLIGYAFEITIVPFHFWAPDVYQGTTAPVSGFLSVVPKIAGFAGLLRFTLHALPGGMMGWPTVLAVLAAVTMTFGNLVALRQNRLKRLLAYSSIAQAGYVMIALAVADRVPGALSAAAYYLAVYLFMNLGAFCVAARLERAVGNDSLSALRGFGFRSPWPAAVLALSLLSLAGIPPLAGFAGKIFLLAATLDGGLVWLAIVAVINMTVALYYYVSVVAQMYFRGPVQAWHTPVYPGDQAAFGLCLAGTFLLGILPALGLAVTQWMAKIVS